MTGAPVPVRGPVRPHDCKCQPRPFPRTFARSRSEFDRAAGDGLRRRHLPRAGRGDEGRERLRRLRPQPLCRGRERAHAPDGRGHRPARRADARRRPQRPCRRAGLPAERAALPRGGKRSRLSCPLRRAHGDVPLPRGTHSRGAAAGLSHRAARPGPAGAGRRPEGRRRRACGILCPAHRNELCRSPAHWHSLGLPCRLHRLCRGGLRDGGPAAGSRRNKEE